MFITTFYLYNVNVYLNKIYSFFHDQMSIIENITYYNYYNCVVDTYTYIH